MTTRYEQSLQVSDVASLFDGVLNVLRFWRDCHTHAPTWATEWLCDAERTVDLDNWNLSNDYFSVDMQEFRLELAKIAIKENMVEDFYCPCCGYEGEEEVCPDCVGEEQCYPNNDPEIYVDGMDFTCIPLDNVRKVLEEFAFPIYSEALEGTICGILENVEEYIEKLESASNNYEKVAFMIQALALAHTKGEIFNDYLHYGMWNIEWSEILNIRENGLSAQFDSEEIKEFLDS